MYPLLTHDREIATGPAGLAADAAGVCSTVRLGIVCPMADESGTAEAFVKAVLSHCGEFRDARFFAVVDNVSSDNTLDILQRLAVAAPSVQVVWAPENTCVVDAYVRGYREALEWGADWILEMDAGFSHDPERMPAFFARMAEGNDCVFGSRFARGGGIEDTSLRRRMVSRGGSVLAKLLLGTTLTDMTSGYEMFTRQALSRVLEEGIQSKAHFFQTEIKFHCRNLRVAEVPILYRTASQRLPSGAVREAFVQLWKLFLRRLRSGRSRANH
jgi:dolichol-phosphate mannosyltransferase